MNDRAKQILKELESAQRFQGILARMELRNEDKRRSD